ncbi:MAG: DUF1351 domain-containing protein [Holdemanella sp.]|nr:DUF1351 domain-containing protein [Holdemanella sp.]
MELRIKEMSLPEAVEFNFEELKQELTDKVAHYKGLVYTDDQIKEAKADVAELRKFTKALSDERIKVKKEFLKPYEAFESKVNELAQIVNEPISLIDSQVKEYESQKKQEKKESIIAYWNEKYSEFIIKIEQIWDDKWLNASASMKSVQEAIDSKTEQISKDIDTLSNLPEFGFEAMQVYKSTLDLTKAISEGHRLAEIQRQKEAYLKVEEERLKAEEANHVVEEPIIAEELEDVMTFDDDAGFIPNFDGTESIWRNYRIELTTNQKTILEQFLISSGIKYQEV